MNRVALLGLTLALLAAPALANAIHDAVGVRIDQVPIGPHMIRKALEDKADGGKGALRGSRCT